MSLSTAKRGTITLYAPPSKNEQEFMYSGKAPGMTFEAFDECVLSWGRDKFGERFAKALWRDELVKLEELDMDDELEAELLGDVLVAELVHVAKLPRRVDVHEREGGLGREEGLLREAHHDGRVLANRVEHDRVFKLGGHLADDVDALGLELTEVGEVVGSHGLQSRGAGRSRQAGRRLVDLVT